MRSMAKGVGMALVLAGAFTAGKSVGAKAPATRREPQFENAEVKVWKSIILPHQPLSLHHHDHGRTIVALKGGVLDVVDANGATLHKVTWETGKAYWLDPDPPGTEHGDLNRGTEAMEVIVVELKNDRKY